MTQNTITARFRIREDQDRAKALDKIEHFGSSDLFEGYTTERDDDRDTFAGDPDPELTNRAMRMWERACYGLANEAGEALKLTTEGSIPHDSMLALSTDDLSNWYADPSGWTVGQCREWIDEHGGEYPSGDGVDAWRDAVRDADTGAEVLQWFRVSRFLAEKLDDAGEVVAEWGNGHIWGRQCCGQAVMLDGIAQRIQRSIEAETRHA